MIAFKQRLKAFKLIFHFRFLAVLDVLFAKRFELRKFRNYGGSWRANGSTKFCKEEIMEAAKKNKL